MSPDITSRSKITRNVPLPQPSVSKPTTGNTTPTATPKVSANPARNKGGFIALPKALVDFVNKRAETKAPSTKPKKQVEKPVEKYIDEEPTLAEMRYGDKTIPEKITKEVLPKKNETKQEWVDRMENQYKDYKKLSEESTLAEMRY